MKKKLNMFALMRRMINIHNLLILSGISIQQKKKESIALIFGQEKSIRMLSFTAVHQ